MTEFIGDLLRAAPLKQNCPAIDSPHQAALALVAYVLGKPKTWVIAHGDAYLTPAQNQELQALIERLCAGEPLPYLTGKQAFYNLDLAVSPDVLIPRPETELLVDRALTWLRAHPQVDRALDLGTGSGAIALALAVHHPGLQVLATDISPDALVIARKNIQKYGLESRVETRESDLLSEVEGKFSLVTANLPYIPSAKLAQVNSLPWEPALALDGGPNGLNLIGRLLHDLPKHLCCPGLALLETEASLGPQTFALAKQAFPQGKLALHPDLAGLDRLVSIELMTTDAPQD